MNKKGFFEAVVTIKVFALLVIILVLYAAVLLAASVIESKDQGDIVSERDESFNDIILLNFLRSEVDGVRMVDLIASSPEDYDLIYERSEVIFGEFPGDFQVLLNIKDECIFDCGTIEAAACAARNWLSEVSIPLVDGGSVDLGFCFYEGLEEDFVKDYSCRRREGC